MTKQMTEGTALEGPTKTLPAARASQLLRRAGHDLHRRAASLEDALAILSLGGFGLVLAALAAPNLLPSPGVPIGIVLGIPLLLLAGQYAFGGERPHLPSWLRRQQRAAPLIGRALRWVAPRVRWWERRVGGRPLDWPQAVCRPALGGWVMLTAVLIILPIPFGNTLPALASVLTGAGLFMNDRITVAAGIGVGMGAIGFAVIMALTAWQVLLSFF
jgi:hypothetical protein